MSEVNINTVKKDLTLPEGKVYILATIFSVIIAIIALTAYGALWGQNGFTISIKPDNFSGFLLTLGLYILVLFLLIIAHELLHAAAFIIFGKSSWKDIRFGIMWRSLTPYCHCSRAVSPKIYRITLVTPTIILGIIPMLIGFLFGIGYLAFMGTFMLIGGIGDFMILFLIRKIPDNALVLDHPNKIGCEVEIFE